MEDIISEDRWQDIIKTGEGYIFNDFSGQGPSGQQYNVLHRAICVFLRSANLSVSKLHFATLEEAEKWLNMFRKDNWKTCSVCCTDISSDSNMFRINRKDSNNNKDRFTAQNNNASTVIQNQQHFNRQLMTEESQENIVKCLIEYGTTISANELVFKNDPLIGDLINTDPFAFLLAASIDRGMAAETAWRVPTKIKAIMGHLDPLIIAGLSTDDMLVILQQIDGKPRYLNDAARTIVEVARFVRDVCNGNAKNLWQGQNASNIKRRLRSIYGIGSGIASMVVNLLASLDKINLLPEDYVEMDVKPDVHVKRVFERTGLCQKDATEQQVVETAKHLHPSYPGILDAPAWHIGRNWCHSQGPMCSECPIGHFCSRRY
ncbi:MAG: hypothetical protein ACYTF1_00245 [Planctomycetota bacterium]|jgi:endonuclease III